MSDLEPNAETVWEVEEYAKAAVSVFARSKFMAVWRHARQRKRYRCGRPRMVSVRMLPKKSYRVRIYEYFRDYAPQRREK
jgi:hypothetical protein